MTDKPAVDAAFCRAHTLIFYPRDEREAQACQKKLFSLGFDWVGVSDARVRHVGDCVRSGLALIGGEIFTNPCDQDKRGALVVGVDIPKEFFIASMPEETFRANARDVLVTKQDPSMASSGLVRDGKPAVKPGI